MKYVIEKMKALTNGGMEAFVFKNTFLIKSPGLNISYYSDAEPVTAKYDEEMKALGRKLTVMPAENKGKVLKRLVICRHFYAHCKKNKPDIVHVHMSCPLELLEGAAAAAAGVKKIILHSHSGDRPGAGTLKKLIFELCRIMMRTGNYRLIACSEMAGRYMFGAKSRFTVLNNGIDTAHFGFDPSVRNEMRDKLGLGDKFVIGHVGRLAKIKNHCFLADIFRCILEKNSHSVLLIAGDGEYEDRIREHIGELGISEKVIFAGAVNDPAPYLFAMDAFVLPSFSEGISIAAIEAQTAGLKTVCSDKVPKEAAVTELCSFMPLEGSPQEWAEHIISECDGYIRKSFAEEVRAKGYDIADTAKQLEEIYSEE
ncbi:MAG: glycosyltransferase [Huintestinicola sp.]|uniref:glycosyltransferase n=1 Tax=Huintestinicola sp. TaxID=2981661 RepID=UPI003F02B342